MKIVLATPLYPPDIAEPAPYVKELAKRLSKEHEVTVVTYGSHPEMIEHVRVVSTDKHRPLYLRLVTYFFSLWSTAAGADVLMVENGASVELPAGILARLSRTRLVLHRGDASAHARASKSRVLTWIEHFVEKKAYAIVENRPLPSPEILPFAPKPVEALAAYEASWENHLTLLNKTIHA